MLGGHTNRVERNVGIDILRIVSTYMVLILHVNGMGGIMDNATGINSYVSIILEQLCIVAVNIFAIISGYCNYKKKFKLKNIVSLWLLVVFYSCGINIVDMIVNNSFSMKTIIISLLPVTSNKYWYFSSYFLLFFAMPVLNNIIKNSNQRSCLVFISIFLFLGSVIGYKADPFNLNFGYTALWLMIMYCVGAYIKKYDVSIKFKNKELNKIIYLLIYLALTGFSLIEKSLDYNYLPTVLSSIFLFLYFSKLNFKTNRIISTLSKTSFAIYIIHLQTVIRYKFIELKFIHYINYKPLTFIFAVLVTAIIIYLLCSILEVIRLQLFKRLGINKLLDLFQNKVDQICDKYFYDKKTTDGQ